MLGVYYPYSLRYYPFKAPFLSVQVCVCECVGQTHSSQQESKSLVPSPLLGIFH